MPPGQNEGQIKKRFTSALDLHGYTGDRTSNNDVFLFWFGAELVRRAGGPLIEHWTIHRDAVAVEAIDWREYVSDKAEHKFDVQINGDGTVTDTDTGDPVIVVAPT